MTLLYILGSVLVTSLISLVGVLGLSLSPHTLRTWLWAMVGLAIGALLGDVFIHIIPETFSEQTALSTPLLLIAGILIFFILEKVLHWHHHHEPEHSTDCPHPIGRLTLVSDSVHNLIDGLLIAASYLVSIEIGIATTIAVVLHEIPQEIGHFGVLIHAGYSRHKALWYNFLSALTSFVGAGIALVVGTASEQFVLWLLPLTAGGFIYIALSDLVPELHKERGVAQSVTQVVAILVGVALMAALLALE